MATTFASGQDARAAHCARPRRGHGGFQSALTDPGVRRPGTGGAQILYGPMCCTSAARYGATTSRCWLPRPGYRLAISPDRISLTRGERLIREVAEGWPARIPSGSRSCRTRRWRGSRLIPAWPLYRTVARASDTARRATRARGAATPARYCRLSQPSIQAEPRCAMKASTSSTATVWTSECSRYCNVPSCARRVVAVMQLLARRSTIQRH
jgi:hypothetical protein